MSLDILDLNKSGYTQAYNKVLDKIDSTYIKTYMMIHKCCYGEKDSCFPSQQTLAEMVGKSVRTIQRHLKWLADNGFIRVKRRGLTLANVYTVVHKVVVDNVKRAKAITNKSKDKHTKPKEHYSKKKKPLKFAQTCDSRNHDEKYYDDLDDLFQDKLHNNSKMFTESDTNKKDLNVCKHSSQNCIW